MSIRIVIVSSMVTFERDLLKLEDGFKNTTAGKSTPEHVAHSKSILKILLLKEMKLFLATTNQMQYTFTKMVKKEVHSMD